MHCPGENATDPIWRVLASSDGITSWSPLKPQHTNPNPLANQLWCSDFFTPPTPLIIPHKLPAFLESLMPRKNWCSIHARWSKSSLKHSIRFCGGIFPKFKTILLHIVLLKCPHVQIAFSKIHQQWQSGFSRVYSNCCWHGILNQRSALGRFVRRYFSGAPNTDSILRCSLIDSYRLQYLTCTSVYIIS